METRRVVFFFEASLLKKTPCCFSSLQVVPLSSSTRCLAAACLLGQSSRWGNVESATPPGCQGRQESSSSSTRLALSSRDWALRDFSPQNKITCILKEATAQRRLVSYCVCLKVHLNECVPSLSVQGHSTRDVAFTQFTVRRITIVPCQHIQRT